MPNTKSGEAQSPNAEFTSQYEEALTRIRHLRLSTESHNYRLALEIERASGLHHRLQEVENSTNSGSASRDNALSRFIDPYTRHQHHLFPVRPPRDPRGREGRHLRRSLESERPSAVNHRSQEDTHGPNQQDTPNENTPLIRIQSPSPVRRNLTTPSFSVANDDASNSYASVQHSPHIRGAYDISPAALPELNRRGSGTLGSVIHRPRPIRRSDSARFHAAMATPETPRVTTQPFAALFGSGPPPPHPSRSNGVSRHDIRAVLNWSTRHLEPVAMTLSEGRKDVPEMCCICWDTMDHSDQDHFPVEIANVEGCRGHVFGMKCIVEWLTNGKPMSNTCPICRTRLVDAHEDTLFLN